jgi:predicted DNA-binding transcriptional regulator YafY
MAITFSTNAVSFCPRYPDRGQFQSSIYATLRPAMVQTSARLLALLSLLQLRREWTGRELAERLEVDPRTIRRDVEKLRSLGYPVKAAPGVAGGYRLGGGGQLPPLLLDDAEAVAVAVGLRTAAAASIAGIEETSVRALAKLEQVLPTRLRRRVGALSAATSAFGTDGPAIDPDVLATIAGACRDGVRLRFSYTTKDERAAQRNTEPCAVVHSGYRWYLVAFDLDRDDWRTFRIDRIRGRLHPGERGRRRTVPGGDPAAYVQQRLHAERGGQPEAPPARIRLYAPAAQIKERMPRRVAEIEPDGEDCCVISSHGPWSRFFLFRTAMLEVPMEVLGPPELIEAARALGTQLKDAAPPPAVAASA